MKNTTQNVNIEFSYDILKEPRGLIYNPNENLSQLIDLEKQQFIDSYKKKLLEIAMKKNISYEVLVSILSEQNVFCN